MQVVVVVERLPAHLLLAQAALVAVEQVVSNQEQVAQQELPTLAVVAEVVVTGMREVLAARGLLSSVILVVNVAQAELSLRLADLLITHLQHLGHLHPNFSRRKQWDILQK